MSIGFSALDVLVREGLLYACICVEDAQGLKERLRKLCRSGRWLAALLDDRRRASRGVADGI